MIATRFRSHSFIICRSGAGNPTQWIRLQAYKRKNIESLLGGHEIGYYRCKHIREDWLYT